MPILQVFSSVANCPEGLGEAVGHRISPILNVPLNKVWLLWLSVPSGNLHRPAFPSVQYPSAPVVVMHCKATYTDDQISRALRAMKSLFASRLGCPEEAVFVLVQRVQPHNLLSFGEVWTPEDIPTADRSIVSMRPIGWVTSPIKEARDDCWGGVVSTIELDRNRFDDDSTLGLSDFSHIEVLFVFHKVSPDDVLMGAKHPRERTDWPRVGIFAQRAKNRPNRIGATVCRLQDVSGTRIHVTGLDAIDGTPLLDLKPYMEEFGPTGPVKQPPWSTELMSGYFGDKRLG